VTPNSVPKLDNSRARVALEQVEAGAAIVDFVALKEDLGLDSSTIGVAKRIGT